MDSFAIASGGATYYRNRINDLLKETDAEGNKYILNNKLKK